MSLYAHESLRNRRNVKAKFLPPEGEMSTFGSLPEEGMMEETQKQNQGTTRWIQMAANQGWDWEEFRMGAPQGLNGKLARRNEFSDGLEEEIVWSGLCFRNTTLVPLWERGAKGEMKINRVSILKQHCISPAFSGSLVNRFFNIACVFYYYSVYLN